MNAGRSAAVVGATGLVGGHLLERILASGRWIRVVTSADGASPSPTPRSGRSRRRPRRRAVGGGPRRGRRVLLPRHHHQESGLAGGLPGRRPRGRVRVAKAASTAGRAFPGRLVARRRSPLPGVLQPHQGRDGARCHRPAVVGYSVFRPSLLLGQRAEARIGERLAALVMRPLGPLLGRYRPIHADTVAAAMVRVAAAAPVGSRVYESDRIAAIASGSITPA